MEEKQDVVVSDAVVVGRNPVLELLGSGREIEKIYVQRGEREGSIKKIFAEARKRAIVVCEADKRRLDELSDGNAHQGVAAITSPVTYSTVEEMIEAARITGERVLLVICDGIEDPHNLGAVLRCADGAGAHGVILSRRHAPAMGPTVFKASAGAAEHVRVARVSNIAQTVEDLKALGIWTFAAEAGGDPYDRTDFACDCALVLGGEGDGVSRLVREKCDFTVSIPMRGHVNSLNVSTAAAVLLYEAAKKQGKF